MWFLYYVHGVKFAFISDKLNLFKMTKELVNIFTKIKIKTYFSKCYRRFLTRGEDRSSRLGHLRYDYYNRNLHVCTVQQ